MAVRTAVLEDERGNLIGTAQVTDHVRAIHHDGRLFVASERGKRLSGGGIGVIYDEIEPAVRNALRPV